MLSASTTAVDGIAIYFTNAACLEALGAREMNLFTGFKLVTLEEGVFGTTGAGGPPGESK